MKIEPRIEKLFLCLAAAKPIKFAAAFPTEGAVNVAKIVWQNGLKDLSDEEVAAGIKALADWMPEDEFERVPTVSEFKNLLCPRITKQRILIAHDNKDFEYASRETAKAGWQSLANKGGKLGATINKILRRYE